MFCFPSSSYLCAAGLKSCTEVPFPILTIFVLVARTVVSIDRLVAYLSFNEDVLPWGRLPS